MTTNIPVYETNNFEIVAAARPFIDRTEGGHMYMQIYGRATTATIQKYGDAVQLPHRETGFYDNFKPLTDDDIHEIRSDMEKLVLSNKYKTPWNEDL